MTPIDLLTLFGVLAALAAVPSTSVLAVSARAASAGFAQGALVALGVVAADLVFVLLAMFGLALLVEAMGELFFLLRWFGGVYLLWLAVMLWRSRGHSQGEALAGPAPGASFLTGFLITLADQKAILFYLGLLPAFVDGGSLSRADTVAICVVTALAVGGVKLVYAGAAARVGRFIGARARGTMTALSAGAMVVAGCWVLLMGRP